MNSWSRPQNLVRVLAEEETDVFAATYTDDDLLYLRFKPGAKVPEHVRNAAKRGDFPLNQENQQMIRKLLHKIDEFQSA